MKKIKFGLFKKILIVYAICGLLPLVLVSTVIINLVMDNYRNALDDGYSKSIEYAANILELELSRYNEISKTQYYYYSNMKTTSKYSIKNIILGGLSEDTQKIAMEAFLSSVVLSNTNITSAYFLTGEEKIFEYATGSITKPSIKKDEIIPASLFNKEYKNLFIFPPRKNNYFSGKNDTVITFGRNYFDVNVAAGKNVYLGTLLFDVNVDAIENIFIDIDGYEDGKIYLLHKSDLMYTNSKNKTFKEFEESDYIIEEKVDAWTLYLVLNYEEMYSYVTNLQKMIYIVVIISLVILIFISYVLTKRLINPINNMTKKMELIENGDFNFTIPVETNDEIGLLANRFNKMSDELNNYINKVYLADLKQKDAELTAIRAQIYPHFLYNTLEIIRMSAIEYNCKEVGEMIEALS
ncbi:MAG: sensor histidine kinase, partial [Lachnospirales bacterium]